MTTSDYIVCKMNVTHIFTFFIYFANNKKASISFWQKLTKHE